MKLQNKAEMEENGGKLKFCKNHPYNDPYVYLKTHRRSEWSRLPLLWSEGGKNQLYGRIEPYLFWSK